MKLSLLAASFLVFVPIAPAAAQTTPSPTPLPSVSSENKEAAYAKLMEGQRFLWQSNPGRNPSNVAANVRNAKLAFQRAVELDPNLSEGYTALAELALSSPPNNVDDAISLATISIKINPNNFGAHRILSRLFTYRSRFNSGTPDQAFVSKAIGEWKEVARLDPRNAEAWAFLSELYSVSGKRDEQIDALRKWISAAPPIETQFYRQSMGGRGDLSPENASVKLGTILIAAGKPDEAVEVLSLLIADNPDNPDIADLLHEALETASPKAVSLAVDPIGQALYAEPGNPSIVNLLSLVYSRLGRVDDAVKVVRGAAERIEKVDKSGSSILQVQLGDLYAANDHIADAISAYEKALSVRGIRENLAVADIDRDFVLQVFEKMIKVYKSANRTSDVRAVIERARKLLGKDDLFAERQLIDLYRESGRRQDALAAIRQLRAKNPADYGLLRLEASVLTESGMVDQGVALITSLLKKPAGETASHPIGPAGSEQVNFSVPVQYDDFTNLLFISHLYIQAGREAEAIKAANQAFDVGGSDERRQIAKTTLASAQQMAGDYAGAEATLRSILKQTPRNPIALNNLGYFLVERNERIAEALELIQQAVKIDPTNPSYLDSRGWAHFALGHLEEAERDLKLASRIDSSSETIHEHLGDVYGKQGKVTQARLSWERALELATNADDIKRIKSKLQK